MNWPLVLHSKISRFWAQANFKSNQNSAKCAGRISSGKVFRGAKFDVISSWLGIKVTPCLPATSTPPPSPAPLRPSAGRTSSATHPSGPTSRKVSHIKHNQPISKSINQQRFYEIVRERIGTRGGILGMARESIGSLARVPWYCLRWLRSPWEPTFVPLLPLVIDLLTHNPKFFCGFTSFGAVKPFGKYGIWRSVTLGNIFSILDGREGMLLHGTELHRHRLPTVSYRNRGRSNSPLLFSNTEGEDNCFL